MTGTKTMRGGLARGAYVGETGLLGGTWAGLLGRNEKTHGNETGMEAETNTIWESLLSTYIVHITAYAPMSLRWQKKKLQRGSGRPNFYETLLETLLKRYFFKNEYEFENLPKYLYRVYVSCVHVLTITKVKKILRCVIPSGLIPM